MTETNDTICAISTPAGTGGIAIIRISGPDTIDAIAPLWKGKSLATVPSHTVHLGNLIDPTSGNETIDQAIATVMRAPHTYTGDDTVELSIHGSVWLQNRIIQILTRPGSKIRLAEPGEYTRRAFLSGNIDLTQAEAVADIIASQSQAAHRLAVNQLRGGVSKQLNNLRQKLIDLTSLLELELDFSEEDIQFASRKHILDLAREIHARISHLCDTYTTGNALLHGIPVAIIGPTNAGKSSLLNALIEDDRAIVSDIHGTTRDIIQETITIDGYQFRLMDTAGLRDTVDTIENLGISRSLDAARHATIVIIVHPLTQPINRDTITAGIPMPQDPANAILLLNKADIAATPDIIPDIPGIGTIITASALTGIGIDKLRRHLADIARHLAEENNHSGADIIITNTRHAIALSNAAEALTRVIGALADNSLPPDLIAEDLRQVIHHIGSITGTITTPDILSTIFSRFCIGK